MEHFALLELKVKDLRCQMLGLIRQSSGTQGKASDIGSS